MKKIALLFLLFPWTLQAQVSIENTSVVKVRDRVDVRFEVHTARGTVRGPYTLVCIPCLSRGSDTVWMKPFEVYSKTGLRRERQARLLAERRRDWTLGANQLLSGSSMLYSTQIPYEPWMRTATLSYRSMAVGCDRCRNHAVLPIAENIRVYVTPHPDMTAVTPDPKRFVVVEPRRRWVFDDDNLKIDFPVRRVALDIGLYDNRQSLDSILSAVQQLQQRADCRLVAIEICGYASPEGTLDLNRRLAEGRAETLRHYICQHNPDLTDRDFYLVNGEENWDGLRRMVADSKMARRAEVLAIIDTVPLAKGRKSRLMRLDGGDTYRYMLREFYPRLRNACYVAVYYDALADPAADAVDEAQTLIRARKYREALNRLAPFVGDQRTFNTIGVCYMMLDAPDQAALWFQKAAANGDKDALRNLEQL